LAPFRELSDLELGALTDDELVAYLAQARALGRIDAARLALQVLVFGHMDAIVYRVRQKVPQEAVDKVAGEAFMSALLSMLSGNSKGEFLSWLHTIVDRRIADYHRAKRLQTQPLAEEHGDEDDVRGSVPSEPDATGAVHVQMLFDEMRGRLDESHRMVVDLYCLDGYPATETARRINHTCPGLDPPMSENNVHQIASRFRNELRARLEADGP